MCVARRKVSSAGEKPSSDDRPRFEFCGCIGPVPAVCGRPLIRASRVPNATRGRKTTFVASASQNGPREISGRSGCDPVFQFISTKNRRSEPLMPDRQDAAEGKCRNLPRQFQNLIGAALEFCLRPNQRAIIPLKGAKKLRSTTLSPITGRQVL